MLRPEPVGPRKRLAVPGGSSKRTQNSSSAASSHDEQFKVPWWPAKLLSKDGLHVPSGETEYETALMSINALGARRLADARRASHKPAAAGPSRAPADSVEGSSIVGLAAGGDQRSVNRHVRFVLPTSSEERHNIW